MEYYCRKTGLEPLDSVHAIGLGILLWGVSGHAVTVEDGGVCYRVAIDTPITQFDMSSVLAQLLPLTTPAGLDADT